jgi:hypothetical protein
MVKKINEDWIKNLGIGFSLASIGIVIAIFLYLITKK